MTEWNYPRDESIDYIVSRNSPVYKPRYPGVPEFDEDDLDDILSTLIRYAHLLNHERYLYLAFRAVSLAIGDDFTGGVGDEVERGHYIYFNRAGSFFKFYIAPQADGVRVKLDTSVHPDGPGVPRV